MRKFLVILSFVLSFTNSFSQNVGIGTTSPAAKLHVVNTGTTILELGNSASLNTNTNSELFFKTGGFYTGVIGTYGTGINTSRLGFSTFASSNPDNLSERLSILDNGNVGINTTTPAYKLDINGNIHGSNNLYVDGNMGIGTLAPGAKLEVNGSVKLSGNIMRTATGSASMLPYAYGSIDENGIILGGTGNFSVTKDAQTGRFLITLTGDNDLWNNRNLYTILVSLATIGGGTTQAEIESSNKIRVRTASYGPDDDHLPSWRNFYILIYRLQ